jgi:predicted acetyltransferase
MTEAQPITAPTDAADRPLIGRMMQPCLYGAAADAPFPIGPDGLHAHDLLDRFWQHPDQFRAEGEIAGLAVVTGACPISGRRPCWFMAEFFVLSPLRRRGLGQRALAETLGRHPGAWHIATHAGNPAGARFRDSALDGRDPTTSRRDLDGIDWTIRAFLA